MKKEVFLGEDGSMRKWKTRRRTVFVRKRRDERRWKEETTKMTNFNAKNDNGGECRGAHASDPVLTKIEDEIENDG